MLKLAKRVCDTCSKLSFAEFELRFAQLESFLNAINNGDENNIVIDSLLLADSITRFGKDLNHTVENEEINLSNRTNLSNVNAENAMPMICHGKVEIRLIVWSQGPKAQASACGQAQEGLSRDSAEGEELKLKIW
uniref:Uncharacterized protein n=1 Tax=Romanomermis culicivorax TaxID=13658 RepID=A0A915IV99_ROMCU